MVSISCPRCGRLYVWDGKRCCRQDCRHGSGVDPIQPALQSTSLGDSTVGFEYDPWRGGFGLLLGPAFLDKAISVFGGLVSVYFDAQRRVAKIESFWDHGGLPL